MSESKTDARITAERRRFLRLDVGYATRADIESLIDMADRTEVAEAELTRIQSLREQQNDEMARALRIGRYHELVDKSFIDGLTTEEAAEKERLRSTLDAFDAAFYKPSIELMEQCAVWKNRAEAAEARVRELEAEFTEDEKEEVKRTRRHKRRLISAGALYE